MENVAIKADRLAPYGRTTEMAVPEMVPVISEGRPAFFSWVNEKAVIVLSELKALPPFSPFPFPPQPATLMSNISIKCMIDIFISFIADHLIDIKNPCAQTTISLFAMCLQIHSAK
jgi:hypothetical protein